MKGFIIALLIALVVAVPARNIHEAMKQLIEQKAKLTKSGVDGKESHPILKAHGSGVTDGQETLATSFIDQAAQIYGSDVYSNALFIQQKIEDSFSGRWNV